VDGRSVRLVGVYPNQTSFLEVACT